MIFTINFGLTTNEYHLSPPLSSALTQSDTPMQINRIVIPRLHDDGAVRNGSAWQGTEQLSSNVYTRFWLCGFLKAIP